MIVSTTGGCSFYFSSFCNNKGNRCRGWRRTAMLEQCRPRQEAPNLWGCTERTKDDFTRNILPPLSPFLCCPGPQRNNIPGQSTRFQPSDNYLALYYLSASQIPGFWREFRKFPHCSRSTPGIIQISELKNRFFLQMLMLPHTTGYHCVVGRWLCLESWSDLLLHWNYNQPIDMGLSLHKNK